MTDERSSAVVRRPVAPIFDQPRISSVQISQLLAGHEVELLEERDGWWCVRGADLYAGWMHRGYLDGDGSGSPRGSTPPRISLGAVVARAGSRRALPLRAFLEPDDVVLSGDVIDAEERGRRFPLDARAITSSACQFFEGTSYLWGGVTPWGADCSGLVQSVFALHGLLLPRDAWQQASAGAPGASHPLDACEGDLLFFSDRADRHVTHVAISLGNRAIVHLALGRGGFRVERLDDAGDPYVATLLERFTTARRVL